MCRIQSVHEISYVTSVPASILILVHYSNAMKNVTERKHVHQHHQRMTLL